MNDVFKDMGEKISSEFAKQGIPASKKHEILRSLKEDDDDKETKSHYLDYLKNKKDVSKIYDLIKSKKHSKNQIRTQLKKFLKDPEELTDFLQSILDSKKSKKDETTEATGAGSAGGYVMPLFSSEEGDITGKKPKVKTVRENVEKVETKEATASSSSGQYSQPAIWAKSMNKKDWKGASTKYMPGAKRVQVKKKCKKFPYCNQGDINALKIFESESVQNAIESVSSNYGYNKEYISEIVFREIRKRQK